MMGARGDPVPGLDIDDCIVVWRGTWDIVAQTSCGAEVIVKHEVFSFHSSQS